MDGTSEIDPPIIALAGDDPMPLVFSTARDAEAYIEPWDANDGLWTVWDRTGQVLELPPVDERKQRTRLIPTGRADEPGLRCALGPIVAQALDTSPDDVAVTPLGALVECASRALRSESGGRSRSLRTWMRRRSRR